MTHLAVKADFLPLIHALPKDHVDRIYTNHQLHTHVLQIVHNGLRHRYSKMRIQQILQNEVELFTAEAKYVSVDGKLMDIEHFQSFPGQSTPVFYDRFMQEKHYEDQSTSHGLALFTFGL
ncbi:MAG: hypothetical protein V4616_08465 [Bacteroidota bacterium]